MIDLVLTHLNQPWGPPWTLETLGDPWRPLATMPENSQNDHFHAWSICSNFYHQYFRRRWWPSSLLFALGLFRTGHWQRSFPTEPTRPDRPLVMINIFLGKCENTFFSLILPNFSTKNKSAKQPITAFFSSRINIFPRKSQNPKNGCCCCCFGGKKSLRQKIINVKLKILFFANLNFWWLAPGCTLSHFVSNLLLRSPRKLKIIWSVPDSCSWQSRFLWENIFPEKIKRRIEFFSVSVAGNPWLWQFVQLTACWKNIKIVRNTNLDFMWTARYFFEPLLLWRRL